MHHLIIENQTFFWKRNGYFFVIIEQYIIISIDVHFFCVLEMILFRFSVHIYSTKKTNV